MRRGMQKPSKSESGISESCLHVLVTEHYVEKYSSDEVLVSDLDILDKV